MWPGQKANISLAGCSQRNEVKIESTLNPYAKEFYPSNMKVWPLKQVESEAKDTKIKMDFRTYELLVGPQEKRVCVFRKAQELVDVKFKAALNNEKYATRILDTKIHITPLRNTSSAATVTKLKKNPVITLNNNNTGAIRKPFQCPASTKKHNEGKGNTATTTTLNLPLKTKFAAGHQSSGLKPLASSALKTPYSAFPKTNLVTKPNNPNPVATTNKSSVKSKNKNSLYSDKGNLSIKVELSSSKVSSTSADTSTSRRSSKEIKSGKLSEKSTASSKSKELPVKLPRTTIASNLRKTEIQKVS